LIPSKRITEIPPDAFQVNELGFSYLDGVRLPFRLVGGEIEFMDKDFERSQERGYRCIRMDIELFRELLANLE